MNGWKNAEHFGVLHIQEMRSMDEAKRKRLEADGWKVGTVQDLFGLTDEDMEVIEKRIEADKERKRQEEQEEQERWLARQWIKKNE